MPKLGLRTLGAIAVLAAAVMTGSGQAAARAGQGEGRRVPDRVLAAVFRGDRARVLQGAEHRTGDHPADRRTAQHRGDDQQSDRGGDRAGDHRGDERQSQEARRRHVYRRAQPEQDLPDGAVRGPQRLSRGVAQGPQGRAHHVRSRTGQRRRRQGGARQGRAQGGRLHHRPARHEPARQRDDRPARSMPATRSSRRPRPCASSASRARSKPA